MYKTKASNKDISKSSSMNRNKANGKNMNKIKAMNNNTMAINKSGNRNKTGKTFNKTINGLTLKWRSNDENVGDFDHGNSCNVKYVGDNDHSEYWNVSMNKTKTTVIGNGNGNGNKT